MTKRKKGSAHVPEDGEAVGVTMTSSNSMSLVWIKDAIQGISQSPTEAAPQLARIAQWQPRNAPYKWSLADSYKPCFNNVTPRLFREIEWSRPLTFSLLLERDALGLHGMKGLKLLSLSLILFVLQISIAGFYGRVSGESLGQFSKSKVRAQKGDSV